MNDRDEIITANPELSFFFFFGGGGGERSSANEITTEKNKTLVEKIGTQHFFKHLEERWEWSSWTFPGSATRLNYHGTEKSH